MSTTKPGELFQTMRGQHARLDAAFREMQDRITGDDREAMRACWWRLEEGLLAHLDLEEMYFLPAIEAKDAAHARAVRAEHDAIRQRLGQIGLALDLHTARAEQLEELAALLRDHAGREEGGLYARAEAELTAEAHKSVLERVRAAMSPLLAR